MSAIRQEQTDPDKENSMDQSIQENYLWIIKDIKNMLGVL